MTTAIEYALMAGASYISTRPDINKFPTPKGWAEIIKLRSNDRDSGFEATTFQQGSDLVISFAGTYPKDITGDIAADIALAGGFLSDQLKQAADYYLQVKASVPDGTTISFTGHSLGGGLASLMAVMFDESAFTFDQAPFLQSAKIFLQPDSFGNTITTSVAQNLRAYLTGRAPDDILAKLDAYIAATDPSNPSPNQIDSLATRSERVTNINTEGEFLSTWFGVPSSNRIGSQANIPNSYDGVSALDLHSQALLTAFLQSQQSADSGKTLSDVTFKLTNLLGMFFDKNLYAFDTDKSDENFLERLVRHEAGNAPEVTTADGMLTRFTEDLWKIAKDGGLSLTDKNLAKALTAFAMQMYYEKDTALDKKLFDDVSGGIHFNRTDVVSTWADIKGKQYIDDYFSKLDGISMFDHIEVPRRLSNLTDWYIQAGNQALNVTATDAPVMMIGGSEDDYLAGGAGDDVLIGNRGKDTLIGGQGDDCLIGGFGNDTLNGGDGNDYLSGGDGNDILNGCDGNDYLSGGDGDDVLNGGDGNDQLNTGLGQSALKGGKGFDEYFLNGCNATVYDEDGLGDIYLNGSILYSSTEFRSSYFTDSNGGYSPFMVANYFEVNKGVFHVALSPSEIALSDKYSSQYISKGASFDFYFDIENTANFTLVSHNSGAWDSFSPSINWIYNYEITDWVEKHWGGDGYSLESWGGVLGHQLDYYAPSGNYDDKVIGTDGNDNLGTGGGNDTLDGGAGDDQLDGGAGSDTYIFGRGYGHDAVTETNAFPAGGAIRSLSAIGGTNTTLLNNRKPIVDQNIFSATDATTDIDVIKITAGIGPNDVTLSRDNCDLTIRINNSNDQITVNGWFRASVNRVEEIIFSDGTVWDTYVMSAAKMEGTLQNDIISGSNDNDVLEGLAGDDSLTGNAGNDILAGGLGNDVLEGGAGDDTYFFSRGDGQDTIGDYESIAGNRDIIKLSEGIAAGDICITHNGSDLVLSINGTTDQITIQNWFSGVDYRVEEVHFADGTIWNTNLLQTAPYLGTAGADSLVGSNDNDTLIGLAADDFISGDVGNDTLNGGSGNDTLDGGIGNDTYLFARGDGQDVISDYDSTAGNSDTILLAAGIAASDVSLWRDASNLYLGINGGSDQITIQSWFDGTAYRVEKVQFADGTIWNASTLAAAKFGGTSGDDNLYGTTGNDSLAGFGGNDSLYGDAGNDTLDGGTGNDTFDGLAGDDQLRGNEGNDTLSGGAGNDLLDGGTGTDTLLGGAGDDVYVVDNIADVVTENANEGTDTVQSSVTWTLGANAENLLLTGAAASNGSGNALDNSITGNDADNILDGGAGNDTLAGGLGNDTYVLDNAADVVVENANAGTDTVQAGFSYALGANLEKLTLTGTAAIDGTGNELANTITGNAAANTLLGGAGNDSLSGGAGNDILDGGVGNDSLNGGAGLDRMTGGLGDDTYVLDNPADTVIEDANAGTDSVQAGFDTPLGANLENLILTGTLAANGFGNALANSLTGNSAANYLFGGLGADTLNGGGGNDQLQGGDDIDTLTDTAGNNLLDGGAGNDTLTAGTGNDLLIGGAGNDTITTGSGADVIAFNRGNGKDTVKSSTGADNTLSLGGGIRYSDLVFHKSSNNLVLDTGNGESITFQNWYAAPANHSVLTLQVIAEASGDYDATSGDALRNQKVQSFDFGALTNSFDTALAATPTLTGWNLNDALLSAHLAGSDTAALGSDLAYQFGKNGSLSGIGIAAGQDALASAGFGSQAQALRPWATVNSGAVQLS